MPSLIKKSILDSGRIAIRQEADALVFLYNSLDDNFCSAVNAIVRSRGRLVVLGIGKSGHIGRKIAATFASTGTPALFVHPTEASHGDLGMIEKFDIVLAISKSGETIELFDSIAYCRRFGIPIIAITANPCSSLGAAAHWILKLPALNEACPLNLAPTTSTIMTLALGDALSIACLQAKKFQSSQFHELHPGGKLGQKLTRVRDIMHPKEVLPLVNQSSHLSEAIVEMSRGRFGCVGIVDKDGALVGIFTDGDLRRRLSEINLSRPIFNFMHLKPKSVNPEALVADVARLLTDKRIPSVFVCQDKIPIGIIHVHDLLQRGFV